MKEGKNRYEKERRIGNMGEQKETLLQKQSYPFILFIFGLSENVFNC
jgi:hypothetical protein